MTATTSAAQEVSVGAIAPDLTLPDSDGLERHVNEFWKSSEKGCVLVFLRHFG